MRVCFKNKQRSEKKKFCVSMKNSMRTFRPFHTVTQSNGSNIEIWIKMNKSSLTVGMSVFCVWVSYVCVYFYTCTFNIMKIDFGKRIANSLLLRIIVCELCLNWRNVTHFTHNIVARKEMSCAIDAVVNTDSKKKTTE